MGNSLIQSGDDDGFNNVPLSGRGAMRGSPITYNAKDGNYWKDRVEAVNGQTHAVLGYRRGYQYWPLDGSAPQSSSTSPARRIRTARRSVIRTNRSGATARMARATPTPKSGCCSSPGPTRARNRRSSPRRPGARSPSRAWSTRSGKSAGARLTPIRWSNSRTRSSRRVTASTIALTSPSSIGFSQAASMPQRPICRGRRLRPSASDCHSADPGRPSDDYVWQGEGDG